MFCLLLRYDNYKGRSLIEIIFTQKSMFSHEVSAFTSLNLSAFSNESSDLEVASLRNTIFMSYDQVINKSL